MLNVKRAGETAGLSKMVERNQIDDLKSATDTSARTVCACVTTSSSLLLLPVLLLTSP